MRLRREGIGPGSTHWWFIIQGVSCLSRPESPGYSVGQCSAVATLDWRIRMIGCVSPWIYMCVLVFLTCARKRRNNNKQERRPEVEVAAFIEPKPVTYRKYCTRGGTSVPMGPTELRRERVLCNLVGSLETGFFYTAANGSLTAPVAPRLPGFRRNTTVWAFNFQAFRPQAQVARFGQSQSLMGGTRFGVVC
jgi:hypothetical protein